MSPREVFIYELNRPIRDGYAVNIKFSSIGLPTFTVFSTPPTEPGDTSTTHYIIFPADRQEFLVYYSTTNY